MLGREFSLELELELSEFAGHPGVLGPHSRVEFLGRGDFKWLELVLFWWNALAVELEHGVPELVCEVA